NLPASLIEGIPQIGDHDTAVVMHNDGVAQGLAEVPFMQDVERWGVLTIGTGLGIARVSKDGSKRDRGLHGSPGDAKHRPETSLMRLLTMRVMHREWRPMQVT